MFYMKIGKCCIQSTVCWPVEPAVKARVEVVPNRRGAVVSEGAFHNNNHKGIYSRRRINGDVVINRVNTNQPGVRARIFKLLSIYLFCLLQSHTFISYNTLIRLHSPKPLSVFFIAFAQAQREKPPWGAEPGFELGPALQQASALPTELCSMLHPNWAMLHPKWAMLHPKELCCTFK